MILTREEKEKLVFDLYNEGKSTREIAQIAHMSFRDISAIIDKKEKEKEAKQGEAQQTMLSTQAYSLFLQVAYRFESREESLDIRRCGSTCQVCYS